MEIIVCDVGNASCNFICSPSGYGMMIDCGSCNDKINPVDVIKNNMRSWMHVVPYKTKTGVEYPMALLHITHPDADHVRNSERVCKELKPYLLRRVYSEEFDDVDTIDKSYIKNFDKPYRGNNPEEIIWGFDIDKQFTIPIEIIKSEDSLKNKIRNNSSIIRYIKYAGISVLFTGDLETAGWEWLIEHNASFVKTMQNGVDILIAPHHGHTSGFPKALLDLIGNVQVIILSKDSEALSSNSCVYTSYSAYASGCKYKTLNNEECYEGKVLTTRSNGNIFLRIEGDGSLHIWADKASSNHKQVIEK